MEQENSLEQEKKELNEELLEIKMHIQILSRTERISTENTFTNSAKLEGMILSKKDYIASAAFNAESSQMTIANSIASLTSMLSRYEEYINKLEDLIGVSFTRINKNQLKIELRELNPADPSFICLIVVQFFDGEVQLVRIEPELDSSFKAAIELRRTGDLKNFISSLRQLYINNFNKNS